MHTILRVRRQRNRSARLGLVIGQLFRRRPRLSTVIRVAMLERKMIALPRPYRVITASIVRNERGQVCRFLIIG